MSLQASFCICECLFEFVILVIYSGHCVPGEGEHKIMDFVRATKSNPSYNPNTAHCIYGYITSFDNITRLNFTHPIHVIHRKDADLMLLALATHEPHFCVIREKMIIRSNFRSNVSRLLGDFLGYARYRIATRIPPFASNHSTSRLGNRQQNNPVPAVA
jgi:hypothetical protein